MHVLLIHQSFVAGDEAGGTRHYEFARQIVRKGHHVTVITSSVNYLSGKSVVSRRYFLTQESKEGISILRIFSLPTLHRSFLWRILSFLSFMIGSILVSFRVKKVDIIIGTSPPLFQALSAWVVARLKGAVFLLEIRDLWPEFAIDMGILRNRFLILWARFVEKFLYRASDHIIVNSPAYLGYLSEKAISSDKVTLIPNGSDPDLLQPTVSLQSVRQGLNLNGAFIVTYTGALGVANDIPTILRVAKRLQDMPHIHFLLVGDGKERLSLETLKVRYGLKNVTFMGLRPKHEIADILSASDVCIATLQDIPMFRMTYPNKVFDYMAAGKPTILAIDGVIRKVIESADGGIFVRPGSDGEIANAIHYLSLNRSSVLKMGLSAQNYVRKYFNRNDQANHFLSLLESFN